MSASSERMWRASHISLIKALAVSRLSIRNLFNRCRPPGNRQPTLEEAAICRPFLFREIAAVQPEVIVVNLQSHVYDADDEFKFPWNCVLEEVWEPKNG